MKLAVIDVPVIEPNVTPAPPPELQMYSVGKVTAVVLVMLLAANVVAAAADP